MRILLAMALAPVVYAADYAAPAGQRPAIRRPGAASILPGGRIVSPLGTQIVTGPGPFGLAISPSGKILVSSNSGPERFSLTVAEQQKDGRRLTRHLVAPRPRRGEEPKSDDPDADWRSVFMGLAFAGEKTLYASEGNSGRVRAIDVRDGRRKASIDLNQDGFADSFTGDLALDPARELLYVVDQTNFRLVTVDLKRGRIAASLRVGRLPFALALSPDRRKAYVTNLGMFEYQPIPGVERGRTRDTGLPFPAFGFPSPEARRGATRETPSGPVAVPGLGDPNATESNSVSIVNLDQPSAPKIEAFVRTGVPFGPHSLGGSSPSGVLATGNRVYVSNAHNDTITAIDAATGAVAGEIPIRIPGLEHLRGVLPLGLAFDEATGWLLVAEAGINAVGVIDTRELRVIGHLPAAWFPTRVLIDRDTVFVSNAKGQGTGPNVYQPGDESFAGVLRRGSVSVFPIPAASELAAQTGRVMAAAGFIPQPRAPAALPSAIRHVVVIVKENRTFDEMLGDIRQASNGPVAGAAALARFGQRGYVEGRGRRFSLQHLSVAPNHRRLATLYSFSDNFYADSEVSVDGHHWVVGSYPNAWTESTRMASGAGQHDFRFPTTAPGRLLFANSNSSVHPEEQLEAGAIWHHLERHGISFRNFGEGFELAGVDEGRGLKPTGARFVTNVPMPDPLYRNTSREYPGFNMNIPDQYRATQFIREIGELYGPGKAPLPRLLFLHLPNDHMTRPRPEDGYPYEASFVADNDYALGRIVEFLSHTPWWREMAVFVTEDDAQGGKDHIDSHRTVLLAAGPYSKKNYVSHVNSSFPGLLKTVFGLLGIPPLNLYDATASSLSDVFTGTPDFTPYTVQPVDPRLFDPEQAREPLDPKPSPRMDSPSFLREQHQR